MTSSVNEYLRRQSANYSALICDVNNLNCDVAIWTGYGWQSAIHFRWDQPLPYKINYYSLGLNFLTESSLYFVVSSFTVNLVNARFKNNFCFTVKLSSLTDCRKVEFMVHKLSIIMTCYFCNNYTLKKVLGINIDFIYLFKLCSIHYINKQANSILRTCIFFSSIYKYFVNF